MKPLNYAELDWDALDRLRERFLAGGPVQRGYWRSREELAAYDASFGERIGWKWDAVVRDLGRIGWRPPAGELVDFGCGSGVAGRRVVAAFPGVFSRIWLHDLSPLASLYAGERARAAFPGVPVAAEPARPAGEAPFTLVVSHVLNELDAEGGRRLMGRIRRAAAVLWVEPGARRDAQELVGWREKILREGRLSVVAPCPHAGRCGLTTPANQRHWCHFFASPPPGLALDADWARFAHRAGIDASAIPYSYLVLARQDVPRFPPNTGRILGRPRRDKVHVRFFNCDAEGVGELRFPERADPLLAERLAEQTEAPLMSWTKEAGGVVSGCPVGAVVSPPESSQKTC